MKRMQVAVSVLLLVLLLVACAPAAAPVPVAAPAAAPLATPAAPAKPAWQEKWNDTVAAATKEGVVTIFLAGGGALRTALGKEFPAAYPLKAEFISGSGAELAPRLLAERRAGIYSVDLWICGTTTTVSELIPRGALDPVPSALILPDVTDPALIKDIWWKGQLSWLDKGQMILVIVADPKNPITVNTELVKTGSIKSLKDLLDPKWKGKILHQDPTISGGGQKWFGVALIAGLADLDYMRALAKQELVFTRDRRLMVDWIVRGKYPIGIASDTMVVEEFRGLGAPVETLLPTEGTYVSASYGALSLVNKAPHPNAASVFINWLLTKEGQTVFARAGGYNSRRLDVPTDHLPPSMVRQPNVEYFDSEVEGVISRTSDIMKEGVAKNVFGLK